MNLQLLTLIGVLAIAVVLPVFMEHVKRAVRFAAKKRDGSLWPLLTDLVAIAWVVVLWQGGLLAVELETPEGVDLSLGPVILVGIAAGVACTLGYDVFRNVRPKGGGGSRDTS